MWGPGEPRKGRKIVAQDASLGERALTPPRAPLSPRGGERAGVKGGFPYPRLAPWATIFRPPEKTGSGPAGPIGCGPRRQPWGKPWRAVAAISDRRS